MGAEAKAEAGAKVGLFECARLRPPAPDDEEADDEAADAERGRAPRGGAMTPLAKVDRPRLTLGDELGGESERPASAA